VRQGRRYTAPYAATKTALLSLTKSLAMGFMHTPVRINLSLSAAWWPKSSRIWNSPRCGLKPDRTIIGIHLPPQTEDIVESLMFLSPDRARSVHGALPLAEPHGS